MELKGLRILVTGGSGFIGSHLVDRLIKLENRVIVYDNLDDFYNGKEENIKHNLRNLNFTFMKLDILDFDSLLSVMKKADVVFHFAAQPGVRYSLENPHKTNIINTAGTLNLLKAALENHVRKVVFASSSSVYGKPRYLPVDEEHPTNPMSIYGASKLAAEKYCKIYHDIFKLPVIILRYHTVYGPRQRPDMAIHKWTRQLFNGEPPTIYGDGEQTRDFTYIDDVIDGTLKAAESNDIDGEIINLGRGIRVKVNEVIKMLIELMDGNGIKPTYEPLQLGDVPDTHADIGKAKKFLKYNPKTGLREGLKKFIEWFKEKQTGSRL